MYLTLNNYRINLLSFRIIQKLINLYGLRENMGKYEFDISPGRQLTYVSNNKSKYMVSDYNTNNFKSYRNQTNIITIRVVFKMTKKVTLYFSFY